MDSEFARYDDVVHQIYDAALQPQRWPDVLVGIADLCGGHMGVLFTPYHNPANGGFGFAHHAFPQACIERWAARMDDPYAIVVAARNLMRDGAVLLGEDILPDEQLVATDFYRDLFAPNDIAHICAGIVFDGTDGCKLPTVATVYASRSKGPFQPRQANMMRRLLAHLSRALGVMYHLRENQLQVAATQAALDRLPAGVVLLDVQGQLQFSNGAAQRLLAGDGPLRLTAGSLALADRLHRLEADFQRAIQAALVPLAQAPAGHFSDALILPDARGRPACVLHVAPLGQGAEWGGGPARAIVFIYDLAAAASVPAEVLRNMFGLTPAEAQAALQVLQGGTVDDMAQRLGVASNTVKSHLKAAFAKTGTHRQADFLKLLLALAAIGR